MPDRIIDDSPETTARVRRAIEEEEAAREENVEVGRALFARLKEVGAVLRAARENEGLSLNDLADRSGFDKGFLSRIENGKANITLETLDRYSAALGRVVSISLDEPVGA